MADAPGALRIGREPSKASAMMTAHPSLQMFVLFALLAVFLSGCGVDGRPKPPAPKAPSVVTITGDARIGVSAEL